MRLSIVSSTEIPSRRNAFPCSRFPFTNGRPCPPWRPGPVNPPGFGVMVPGISNVSCLEVPAVEGKADCRVTGDDGSDGRILGLQNRRRAADRHFVGHGPELERQIDSCRLIHFELDGVRNDLLEPRQFGGDHVGADWQKRDPVHARVARFCNVLQFRRLIHRDDLDSRDGSAAWIDDGACQLSLCTFVRRSSPAGRRSPARSAQSTERLAESSLVPSSNCRIPVTMSQPWA